MSDADQINGSTKKLLDKLDRNAHAAALKVLKSCFSDLVSNASVKDEKDAANKKTADELLFHMTAEVIGHVSINLSQLYEAKLKRHLVGSEIDVEGDSTRMAVNFLHDKLNLQRRGRMPQNNDIEDPNTLTPIAWFALNLMGRVHDGRVLYDLHKSIRHEWVLQKGSNPVTGHFWPTTDWYSLWRRCCDREKIRLILKFGFIWTDASLDIMEALDTLSVPVVRRLTRLTLVVPAKEDCTSCGTKIGEGHVRNCEIAKVFLFENNKRTRVADHVVFVNRILAAACKHALEDESYLL